MGAWKDFQSLQTIILIIIFIIGSLYLFVRIRKDRYEKKFEEDHLLFRTLHTEVDQINMNSLFVLVIIDVRKPSIKEINLAAKALMRNTSYEAEQPLTLIKVKYQGQFRIAVVSVWHKPNFNLLSSKFSAIAMNDCFPIV